MLRVRTQTQRLGRLRGTEIMLLHKDVCLTPCFQAPLPHCLWVWHLGYGTTHLFHGTQILWNPGMVGEGQLTQ